MESLQTPQHHENQDKGEKECGVKHMPMGNNARNLEPEKRKAVGVALSSATAAQNILSGVHCGCSKQWRLKLPSESLQRQGQVMKQPNNILKLRNLDLLIYPWPELRRWNVASDLMSPLLLPGFSGLTWAPFLFLFTYLPPFLNLFTVRFVSYFLV
ncbi:PREDICTED: LOW QUALITY PROTEIN: uncharacterized protein C10orf111 homolog [Colobus angolensis palliatus]|uniref:LOW QUALITY PROTEIN: uncharacterized protein C10orf111 homolog n=1 Tax=Colobus angolensis palliatus TaxID=336983 RepID=UPI0005F3A2C0|nr:PREDICTED: LOW QUALITY PROTEIN: uncharacterized protein C10orf111 homolog [Colobus angolensis palliatus]